MKKLLLTLTLLLSIANAKPILQLDTGGHTGMIRDIITTKSGDIISASDDKTIRVWDGQTGREKRKILGQIGAGSEGKVYAIALSPDESYLAVGGYLTGEKLEEKIAIRIYYYPTGKLIKLLKSHTNAVADLAFSQDGRYLISGSTDATAKIWDVAENFTLKDTIAFHSKEVYAVRIIQKEGQYFAVTAGDDNQIALYDMQKREVVKSHRSKYNLDYLATVDNLFNGRIAVCGYGKEITIYDFNLKFIKKVKSETKPAGLAYSPNGKLLIAGMGAHPYNVNIYQSKNNYRKKTSFKKHTNTTMAVGFLDNHTAVSAGGTNNEIYIWNTNTKKVSQKIVGAGERVWSVGIRGDRIAWGNKYTKTEGKSELQKSINLKNFSIDTSIRQNSFKRISTSNGSYSLSHSKGGKYGYSSAVLNIKKNGRVAASIVKGSTNGLGHNCYGWYKEYIISGGSNGHLKIYNKEGREVASLIGHTGEIWSIAVDGDKLVSGSDDQTIRVWNLSELENKSKLYPMLNIFVSKDNEWVVWSQSGYYNASLEGDKQIGYHINQGADKEAYFVSSDKYADTLYRPDIIELILEIGSEKKAITLAAEKRKVHTVDIAEALPPIVTLLSSSRIQTDKETLSIDYTVQSKEPITKTIVTLNGRQIDTRSITRKQQAGKKRITVELDEGENIIAIQARNKFAMSDQVLVYAHKRGKTADIYKPTLYLLSIGISAYKDTAFNLGVADKDALAVTKMFRAQSGKLYKEVQVKTLTNDKADSGAILDGLDWIDKEATSKDVVILFIAGHGVNDEKGNYYFLAHEANLERLRRTAVNWKEIQDTISNLPSKVILLADTCHSGNIAGTRRDITSAIKSIISSGSGSIIMTATTGNGYSYEQRDWGHGAFTKAFLEGISDAKADYDSDGTITIKEIDLYVTNRVKELTKGKQKPTTITPQSIPDFAIGVR